MNELKVPELFKGPWEHALILTYGADLPFFENALWQQFSKRCRNKIILADGQQYLDACAMYARGGLVRHLNQRYIVEGIFTPHAAHGKVILLTNPKEGRLLVGSGNLGWQGYASGGEQFTQYAYAEDTPEALNAFLVIHEIIQTLIEQHYIRGPAVRRLRHLWEQTLWLFKAPNNVWRPVHHNLEHNFIDQLRDVIGEDPVEELWILSPFYDQHAIALERLLTVFNPHQATLLMQAGATSVDPAALQGVLDRFADRCRVYTFTKDDEAIYVHAKLYLFKLKNRAVCLQGSPNLSQAALLRTLPQGNLEIANLLTGPRDAFDALIETLDIQPVLHIEALNLTYQSSNTSSETQEMPWQLTGGEWCDNRLILRYQGILPNLQDAKLCIAGTKFALDVRQCDNQCLELVLPEEAIGLLQRPVPVSLIWEGEVSYDSNPVFVYNLAALAREIDITDDQDTLPGIGDLDLDDEELERLLGELEASLIIDRRSLWQVAGKRVPSPSEVNEDEALYISYDEIDYDALRKHPKIQQYIRSGTVESSCQRTRLQIILSAITDHFQGLIDPTSAAQSALQVLDELNEENDDTDTDVNQRHRRQTSTQRISRILKQFIRRYLRGLRSSDFLEIAGFEVVAQNYVIFSHILWRLLLKEWVEPLFLLESFLKIWRFFWGDAENDGYFKTLTTEQQAQVLQWMHGQYTKTTLLAALYYGAYLTHLEKWQDQRFALRDFWRHLLTTAPFEITPEILETVWYVVAHILPYQPPRPTEIVSELKSLAKFESRATLLQAIEQQQGYPRLSCDFKNEGVKQRPQPVKTLIIEAPCALENKETAFALLGLWMRSEELDYYRIQHPETGRLLFYDVWKKTGTYWAKDRGEQPEDFEKFTPSLRAWDLELEQLRVIAVCLDEQFTIAIKSRVLV